MTRRKPRKTTGRPLPPLPKLPAEVREAMLKLPPEPGLFADTLGALLEGRGRVRDIDVCVEAYRRFHGLSAREALSAEHLVGMGALFCRLKALSEVIPMLDPDDTGDRRFQAMVEAACTARLIEKDGKPAFQLLDFLGALGRAEAEQ